MSASESTSRTGSSQQRDTRLDALRGLAIVLMVFDHLLAVAAGFATPTWLHWIRDTVTRLSLPLFMVVSGILLERRKGFSTERVIRILYCALFVNCLVLAIKVGLGFPDILGLWLLAVAISPVILRYPVEVLILGFLQAINLPIQWSLWTNYQPGWVIGWVALGVLVSRTEEPAMLRPASTLPHWLESIGRRPLLWYVGHIVLILATTLTLLLLNPDWKFAA